MQGRHKRSQWNLTAHEDFFARMDKLADLSFFRQLPQARIQRQRRLSMLTKKSCCTETSLTNSIYPILRLRGQTHVYPVCYAFHFKPSFFLSELEVWELPQAVSFPCPPDEEGCSLWAQPTIMMWCRTPLHTGQDLDYIRRTALKRIFAHVQKHAVVRFHALAAVPPVLQGVSYFHMYQEAASLFSWQVHSTRWVPLRLDKSWILLPFQCWEGAMKEGKDRS